MFKTYWRERFPNLSLFSHLNLTLLLQETKENAGCHANSNKLNEIQELLVRADFHSVICKCWHHFNKFM